MQFLIDHKVEILAALLAVSEVLGAIPAIGANGIFDAAVKVLKSLAGK